MSPLVAPSLAMSGAACSAAADWTGDEDDGYNETILPCDFKQAGQIVDDELNQYLANPLPPGVRLTAIIGTKKKKQVAAGRGRCVESEKLCLPEQASETKCCFGSD
jgi:Caspase domain